jgi:hypothetical protein
MKDDKEVDKTDWMGTSSEIAEIFNRNDSYLRISCSSTALVSTFCFLSSSDTCPSISPCPAATPGLPPGLPSSDGSPFTCVEKLGAFPDVRAARAAASFVRFSSKSRFRSASLAAFSSSFFLRLVSFSRSLASSLSCLAVLGTCQEK